MAINWNEATVGETEIERTDGIRVAFKIMAIDGDTCWCKDEKGEYYTHKKHLFEEYWTIYDPWEEITDHRWIQVECTGGSRWKLMRGDRPIYVDGIHYKSDGRRVWQRKEG